MTEKAVNADMIVNQLEDALEERQNPDRRKIKQELPSGVVADRRKGDRRKQEEALKDQ